MFSSFEVKDENGVVDENYSERILPSAKVESALIDMINADPSVKRRALNGSVNIEEKEQIINTAKYFVLEDGFENRTNEFAKANEMLYKYKDLKNIPNSVIQAVNKIKTNAVNDIRATNVELTGTVDGDVFANNFQMTDMFTEWRDRHIDGGLKGDLSDAVGTFVQESARLGLKATAGTSIWVSRLLTEATGVDDTSQDWLEDKFSNIVNQNVLGTSEKVSLECYLLRLVLVCLLEKEMLKV